MDSNSFNSWSSKSRLQEFRSKINFRQESPSNKHLEAFKQKVYSSIQQTPKSEISKTNERQHQSNSLNLSHYKSISNFKSNSVFFKPRKHLGQFNGDQKSSIQKTPNGSSPGKSKDHNDFSGKSLQEIISIGTLSKATGLVTKTGINHLPLGYIRQLRQLANEVLSSLND